MQDTVLVTGYTVKKFTVEENKEKKEIDMMKVSYLTKFSGVDAIGSLPTQITFMNEQKSMMAKRIDRVPGLYNVEYAMVPGKNNKPSMQIVDFTFIQDVDLKPLFDIKASSKVS